jgi:hypothetical protein
MNVFGNCDNLWDKIYSMFPISKVKSTFNIEQERQPWK